MLDRGHATVTVNMAISSEIVHQKKVWKVSCSLTGNSVRGLGLAFLSRWPADSATSNLGLILVYGSVLFVLWIMRMDGLKLGRSRTNTLKAGTRILAVRLAIVALLRTRLT